jgi:serine protease Do
MRGRRSCLAAICTSSLWLPTFAWFSLAASEVTHAQTGGANLVQTIAQVKPSVVIVGTFNPLGSPRFGLRGTGFVAGQGNWAVTNAHVLPEGWEPDGRLGNAARLAVQVRLPDGSLSLRMAKVLEHVPTHDLALLQFEGDPAPILTIGAAPSKEGDLLAFMGFPIGGALGYSAVTHRAIVSSVTTIALPQGNSQQINARAARALREGNFDIYQLDGTAYPGNSGGPLFDPDTGEVRGVINMVFVKGSRESALSHPSGISYAIPAKFVGEMLKRAQR